MEGQDQPNDAQQLDALPQSVLEQILIPGTSTKDKKALRQTCKLFKQILDDRLSRVNVVMDKEQERPCVEGFLKRMRHVHCLKTVMLSTSLANTLFRHLPDHLTMLTVIISGVLNLKELKRLQCLTALNVEVGIFGEIQGLEDVCGLASLRCSKLSCSLAQSAPTLKHLSIRDYDSVLQIDQLTNLEALQVTGYLPTDFFHTHGKLPLKHLYIHSMHCRELLSDCQAWQAAPTTLTRLSLKDTPSIQTDVLPIHITHLQLLGACVRSIDQALTALPLLQQLDVFLFEATKHDCDGAFGSLSKHTNLQELGICVNDDEGRVWQSDQVLSKLPQVVTAVGRGVKLNVVSDPEQLLGVFQNPFLWKSTWVTQTSA